MNHPSNEDKPLPPEDGSNASASGAGASSEGASASKGDSASSEVGSVPADSVPAGDSASAEKGTASTASGTAEAANAADAAGSSLDKGTPAHAAGVSSKPAFATASAARTEDMAAGEEDEDEWEDDDEKPSSILPADFWSHVEDLRWVLLKSASVFMGAMLLMMLFSVKAQKLLAWPLQYGLHLSGSEIADIQLRTDGPFSVFTFMLQLWVFGGLLLSLPFMLYFASSFIAPGLTVKEKKMLRPVAFSALVLFLLGCGFAFFLLLPTYIAVSLSLEQMFGFASLWTPGNYYGAVVWTTLGMGVVFQFPLVLILLQYLGLVSAATLKQYRRHAFVFILIFAALLTPGGDPISLAVCALPLYGLFELSLLAGERIRKRAAAKVEEYEDEYY